MSKRSAEVYRFWFGELDSQGLPSAPVRSRWFGGGPAFDDSIRVRFEGAVLVALRGGLSSWETRPPSRLSLVLLLDQFTRNIFRGDPRSFAGDSRALELAQRTVEAGEHRSLKPIERSFLYLPFEHAEDSAMQERSVELYSELAQEDAGRALFEDNLVWARRHAEVIERFGRFPSRNAVLGRESTREEIEFLAENPVGF